MESYKKKRRARRAWPLGAPQTTQAVPDIRSTEIEPESQVSSLSRRKFMGTVAATAASVGATGLSPILGTRAEAQTATARPEGVVNPRVAKSYALRVAAATKEALIPVPPHTTNGDEALYPDKSRTYTKGLLQDRYGVVNLAAYQSLKTALATGNPADFENIILGGTRTLNGPQGALAFGLEGTDAVQFGNAPCPADQENVVMVPPPPAVASPAYGTELVEMYWGSLLRDVAFTDYADDPNGYGQAAAAELTNMPYYAGPRDGNGRVIPTLLFRGGYPGETVGPYISQLFITPTMLGQQAISQQYTTYAPSVDFMTDINEWFAVQNGTDTGRRTTNDPQPRYLHNGRGLAAYTHVDVLYQAYFTAFLALLTLGFPFNPGNPYVHSRTQNGFDTFGGPDIAASLGGIGARALDVVWYQKWVTHLRHRPESGGGLVALQKNPSLGSADAKVNNNVLNSQALQASFNKYHSYLLAQAFPEGSPTHPAYPTGHGMVGGACITLLKFFFDGSQLFSDFATPMAPTNDGLSLVRYTGADAGQMSVNGELNKIADNVTFGHGIHAGIHWRSDSDISMRLGEAFAISVLQDKARQYHEKFTISFQKLDGTTATISNQGL